MKHPPPDKLIRLRDKMNKIDEKTWMPVGLAVTVIGGMTAWLTAMYSTQQALARTIDSHEYRLTQLSSDIQEIKVRLAQIQVGLERGRFQRER